MITILIRGEGGAPEKYVIDVNSDNILLIKCVIVKGLHDYGLKHKIRDEFL